MANFDYRKDSLKVDELLPENLQTEIMVSVFNNGINRLLTSPDTVRSAGSIGQNYKKVYKNRIKEDVNHKDYIHRTTYQLQPLVYSKIATEEFITSYKDILTKLQFLCGDDIVDRQDKWADCEQFDFAPPIDLDKFVNYQNYVWVDNTEPDYITMNNSLTRANSRVAELSKNSATATVIQPYLDSVTNLTKQISDIMHKTIWANNVIDHKYMWIESNKWVHKSDAPAGFLPAERPIIEYFSNIEVNEWNYTKHNWLYRKNILSPWIPSDTGPTDSELLTRYPIIDWNPAASSMTIASNLTSVFVKDLKFTIKEATDSSNNNYYTVVSSTVDTTNGNTIIVVSETITAMAKHNIAQSYSYVGNTNNTMPDENLGTTGDFYGIIVPVAKTSKGDNWLGLHQHWAWVSQELQTAVNHQIQDAAQFEQVFVVGNEAYDTQAYDAELGFDGKTRYTFDVPYIYDTDDLQVYINGVRQYGTYNEVIDDVDSRFDDDPLEFTRYEYPNVPVLVSSYSIDFTIPLARHDTILIKVGAPCEKDVKKHGITVGCYDETNPNTPKLKYKNLVEYRLHEQVKINKNQYLHFDLYHPNEQTAYTANPIFKYKEDISFNYDNLLMVRTNIVESNDPNKPYDINAIFENLAVDDNGLLCYKQYENSVENLYSIWRKCPDNYVPQKVDIYRNPVLDTTTPCDWELPAPFIHNIYNECRVDVLYKELKNHFNDILTYQTLSSDFANVTYVAKMLENYVYSGGYIKVFNGRYDLLVSSIHQNIVNIITLINYAKQQYFDNIDNLKTTILKNILSNDNYDSNYHISNFVENTYLNRTFSDSTTVKTVANIKYGIKNWITTLPILGFMEPVEPRHIYDSKLGINKILHHDGHYSDISHDTLIDAIVSKYKKNNPAYIEADINNLIDVVNKNIIETVLKVENKLYGRAKLEHIKFNYVDIINGEQSLFDDKLNILFSEYVKSLDDMAITNDFTIGDAFTWNYSGIETEPALTISQNPTKWGAHWKEIYKQQYNTSYPHLEPWKLQGYTEKPTHWDSVYLDSGTWSPQMWTNIRNGIIDSGLSAPPSSPPTYTIISVNDTGTKHGSYDVNELIPPYVSIPALSQNSLIFGDMTSVEAVNIISKVTNNYIRQRYEESINYNYDKFMVLFKLQPLKILRLAFGDEYYDTTKNGGLLINKTSNAVPSHKDIIFHGTLVNNVSYSAHGINQWYTNILRSENNIISMDDFITMWTAWESKLSYQTNSIINDKTLMLDNEFFNIYHQDYSVHVKKSPSVIAKWLHSLLFSVYRSGTYGYKNGVKIPTDGNDWLFTVDIPVTGNQELYYYGTRNYKIRSVDVVNNTFSLDVSEAIMGSNITETQLLENNKNILWNNNETVFVDYVSPTLNKSFDYAIVKYDTNTFGLSKYNSNTNTTEVIDLYDTINCYYIPDSITIGSLRIDKDNNLYQYTANGWEILSNSSNDFIVSAFTDIKLYNNGLPLLIGYTITGTTISIDKSITLNDFTVVLDYTHPVPVYTIPVLFNDGDLKYNASNKIMQYRAMAGVWVSYSTTTNDFILPTDSSDVYIYNDSKLLSYGYTITGSKVSLDSSVILNNLHIKIAIPSNTTIQQRLDEFTVLDKSNNSDMWYNLVLDKQNVKKIILKNDKFIGIQPIIDFIQGYYVYATDNGFVLTDELNPKNDVEYPTRIRGWKLEIEKFIHTLYSGADFTTILVNPFRYEFWVNTPVGVVSDLLRGPYRDVNLYPIVYDSLGKSIKSMENLKLFRTDKSSHLTYPENSDNFIGGIHIFLDYYEHVIMFNDYTINYNMIYDHFVGVNNEDIKISLNKHYETNGRPNIGGGFLSNNNIIDNIETDAMNFQQLYDIYADTEENEYINNVRALLGYDNSKDYGTFNAKSKFLFWKGLMHQKGTSDSVNMFATQGHSTNINIDEYWAYRISEYGDAKIKREQYVNIKSSDFINHNILYQFVTDGYIKDTKFIQIDKNDITRWDDTTTDNNGTINLEFSSCVRIEINNYKKSSNPHPLTTIIDTTSYPYLYLDSYIDDCDIFVENEHNEYFNYPVSSCVITVPQYTDISSVIIAKEAVSYIKLTNTTLELPITGNYKDVIVTYSDGTSETAVAVPYTVVVEIPFHIPNIGMITVYANNSEVKFTSIDNTHISIHLSDVSQFSKLAISVLFNRGKLVKDVHFTILKSNLIKFHISEIIFRDLAVCDVNLLNYYNKLTASVIDTNNDILLSTVPYYHPALKIYPTKISLVEYISDSDPANYADFKWSDPELGQKWLDVSNLGYYMYHDKQIYPKLEDRIAYWGLTSEWSRIQCYEWVSSTVPPNVWEDNNQIGKPLAILYKQVKNTIFDFWEDEYVEKTTYQIINSFDHATTDGTLTFLVSLNVSTTDVYKLYINEILTTDYSINITNGVISSIVVNNITNKDTIRLVRFADDVTTKNITSKSNDMVKYRFEYPYNSIVTYDNIGINGATTYYFWATNQISRNYNNLSTYDIEQLFIYNNNPYHFYQGLDKWVVKNVNEYLNYNDIALQIIKNDTITSDNPIIDNVNNVYKEWTLINEKANKKIPFMLWIRIIESMVGKSINDYSAVPEYNKVVFDNIHNTNTRYGINPGQVVGDKDNVITSIFDLLYDGSFNIDNILTPTATVTSLATIITSIATDKENFLYYYKFNDSSNYNIKYKFYDDRDIIHGLAYIDSGLLNNISTKLTTIVSKDGFLDTYKFNAMDNIIEGMLLLYLTCSTETVNTIFFHIFKDMVAYNTKLDGIFKTSLIVANCEITLNKTS
jgi:hypothetical protein